MDAYVGIAPEPNVEGPGLVEGGVSAVVDPGDEHGLVGGPDGRLDGLGWVEGGEDEGEIREEDVSVQHD